MVFCIAKKTIPDDISIYILLSFMCKIDILNLISSYRISRKLSDHLMSILKSDNFFISECMLFSEKEILKSTSLYFNKKNQDQVDKCYYSEKVISLACFNADHHLIHKFNSLTKLSIHVYRQFDTFQINSLFLLLS